MGSRRGAAGSAGFQHPSAARQTTGTQRRGGEASLAFLPLPAPTLLSPRAEFWPISWGAKWPFSLPREPEAHYEKLF